MTQHRLSTKVMPDQSVTLEHYQDNRLVAWRLMGRYEYHTMICDVPVDAVEVIYLLYTVFGVTLSPQQLNDHRQKVLPALSF